jgi:hypothetical protein
MSEPLPERLKSAVAAIIDAFRETPRLSDGIKKLSKESLVCRLAEKRLAESETNSALEWLVEQRYLTKSVGMIRVFCSGEWQLKRPELRFGETGPIMYLETPSLWNLRVPIAPDEPPENTDVDPGHDQRKTVNDKMMSLMTKRPESKSWSARNFADALGCAKSTVSETTMWKTLMEKREAIRQQRVSDIRLRQKQVESPDD